ncbi:hypothetical protein P7C70_g3940, partial [Phenoliferia sp. Uapishka_3]
MLARRFLRRRVEEADTSADEKVASLEAKLALLEARLADQAPSTQTETDHPEPSKDDVDPEANSHPIQSRQQSLTVAIYHAVVTEAPLDHSASLATFLMGQLKLGPSNSEWKLALPSVASALTRHLLDAAQASSFSRLPAFDLIIKRLRPSDFESPESSPSQVRIQFPRGDRGTRGAWCTNESTLG